MFAAFCTIKFGAAEARHLFHSLLPTTTIAVTVAAATISTVAATSSLPTPPPGVVHTMACGAGYLYDAVSPAPMSLSPPPNAFNTIANAAARRCAHHGVRRWVPLRRCEPRSHVAVTAAQRLRHHR
ncbi:hypothetical protein DFH09DRAFT_1315083 [Mycena vulgaris]|nr:hypothetical protein DFH09DRAFT_1315083 [Mycena vulgaris]